MHILVEYDVEDNDDDDDDDAVHIHIQELVVHSLVHKKVQILL
jgi:hypothetical protein